MMVFLCVGMRATAEHAGDTVNAATSEWRDEKSVRVSVSESGSDNGMGGEGEGIMAVVNTWPWTAATDSAFLVLSNHRSPLDAVQQGCKTCQDLQCDTTVGFGGSPDENGETTLDAMIMDGDNFRVGAVGNLRRVKDAVGVARYVMEFTSHTFLAGDQLTQFAIQNGFPEEDLSTPASQQMHQSWLNANCQPNYRTNVIPDPKKSCGPYKPSHNISSRSSSSSSSSSFSASSQSHSPRIQLAQNNHDTIAVVALHTNGSMAAATSTNGARNKIPGRVGDSPVVGSGSYVDSTVGGCGETGDGDVMMRFSPTLLAVEFMRSGLSPSSASVRALSRVAQYFPSYQGALVCLTNKGEHGAASYGWTFQYAVRTSGMNATQVITVPPFTLNKSGQAVFSKQ